MATLIYDNVEFNIVYIDPTIASAGDGTTPALALSDLPNTLVDNTCYLMRRTNEETHVSLKQTKNTGLVNTILMGMPFKDNPIYGMLPEEVKTAWGNDSEINKYSNVLCNTSYTDNNSGSWDYTRDGSIFYEWNTKIFMAQNCYFYRDNDGASGYRALYYMFCFPSNSVSQNITFNSCKFGYTQYDLDNDDWLANNTDITTNTTKYPQRKARNYVGIWSANSVTFDDCIFNFVGEDYGETYSGDYGYLNPFYANNIILVYYFARTFNFTNCTLNNLQRWCYWYNSGGNRPWNVDGYSVCYGYYTQSNTNDNILSQYRRDDYVNLENITLNTIVTGGYYIDKPLMLNINNADHLKAKNLTLNIKAMKNAQVDSINVYRSNSFSNDNMRYNSKFIRFGSIRKSIQIDGITADLDNSPCKLSNANILEIYNVQTAAYGNPTDYIKNIYVRLTQDRNNLNDNNYRNARYYGSGGDIVTIRARNDECWYWDSGQAGYWYLTTDLNNGYFNFQNTYLIDNIIVEAQYADTYALSLEHVGAKSKSIKGRVYLYNAIFDVDKIYNYKANQNGIYVNHNSFIKCNEYEADLVQTEYKYEGNTHLNYGWIDGLSSAYIGKSNVILFDEYVGAGKYGMASQCQFVCPNYILQGQYFAKNSNTICKSWNVVRQDSNAVATLRFNNNTCSMNPPRLVIGLEPYKGIAITPVSIGKKKAICYFACKNFSENELWQGSDKFVVEINCPYFEVDRFDSEVTNLYYKTYSTCGKPWISDTSTWSGDTNLRVFRVEMPIEVFTLDEQIDVKVWYNWYGVNGYAYFDPDVKLVDIAQE